MGEDLWRERRRAWAEEALGFIRILEFDRKPLAVDADERSGSPNCGATSPGAGPGASRAGRALKRVGGA